jgi:hypothetical protein
MSMSTPTDLYAVLLAVTDGQGRSQTCDITPPACTVAAAVAVARAELAHNPWAVTAQVLVGHKGERVWTTLHREPSDQVNPVAAC